MFLSNARLPSNADLSGLSKQCLAIAWPLLLIFAVVASGCGEIKIKAPKDVIDVEPDIVNTSEINGETDTDSQTDNDIATSDTIGDDTAVAEVAGDAQNSDAPGTQCETATDCAGKVLGLTPCIHAACENGYCVKSKKATGATCKDSKLELGDCNVALCTDSGSCELANAPEGTICGLGACGKKCALGQCVAATLADFDDKNLCTADSCDPSTGVAHKPLTDFTLICDDGDSCTSGDSCIAGTCKGQAGDCSDGYDCTLDSCDKDKGCLHTPNAAKCDDGNPCTKQDCDAAKGCIVNGFNAATPCNDLNSCTANDACSDSGACVGVSSCKCVTDAECNVGSDLNLCLGLLKCSAGLCVADTTLAVKCDASGNGTCVKNTCNPKSGVCAPVPQNDDGSCDDANACTSKSFCVVGVCQGSPDVTCDDKNTCTLDTCQPVKGCVHTPSEDKCDDNNACTLSDVCVNGGCIGTAKVCDDGVLCTIDTCDTKAGGCVNLGDNKGCDDKNPCTTDTCVAGKGCTFAANDSGTCDDGDACTADSCSGGKCVAKFTCQCTTDANCNDGNPCTTDKCVAGSCKTTSADGGKCDTGDKCQHPLTGLCSAGACKSGNAPVDCSSKADSCNTAQCNPGTGLCEVLSKADGSVCDADKNGCTVGDACLAGKCLAGKLPDCSAKNGPCTDGSCQSASSTTFSCFGLGKAKGTPCEDGQFCTTGEACDAAGACNGGIAKTCGEVADACNFGSCDEVKKVCVKAPKSVAITCDDGLFCTSGDHCDGAGKCLSGAPLSCGGGVCTTGKCDEVGKKCSTTNNVSGSPCSDNSLCTKTDACDGAGKCVGSSPVVCTNGNVCNDALCNAVTGACDLKPKGNTTPCDDLSKCTTGDHCDGSGACAGGAWDNTCGCNADSLCNDGNACTTDKCDKVAAKCVFTITAKAVCDDGNPCTTASVCNDAGACVGTANMDCSAVKDQCNDGACANKGGVGACKQVPLAAGLVCNDTFFCTTGDVCDGLGKCAGPNPVACKATMCNTAACSETAKGCQTTPQGKGTSCNDSNACTVGDQCDGAGACLAGTPLADFSICDDANPATSGDFCLKSGCAGFTSSMPGAFGPVSDVIYQAKPAIWTATMAAGPLADGQAEGDFSVYQLKKNASGGFDAAALFKGNQTNLRQIHQGVAVGTKNNIWFAPTSNNVWTGPTGTLLGKGIDAIIPPSTDWYAVDTRQVGTILSVIVGGYAPTLGINRIVVCKGQADGTGSFACINANLASGNTIGAVAAHGNTPACIPPNCPAPTVTYDTLALNGAVGAAFTSINQFSSTWTNTASLLGNVVLAASTSSSIGALLSYDQTGFTISGGSEEWGVGPVGTIYLKRTGTSGLINVPIFTPAIQSGYVFTGVAYVNGNVLVWGNKPDSASSFSRIPVLLTHKDDANSQLTQSTWVEHPMTAVAALPANCADNGLVTGSIALGDSIVAAANVCANPFLSKGTSARRSVFYIR